MEGQEIVTFCQSDLLSASFAVFQDMRIKKELCDVSVKMGNSTFVAHRVILAAAIPYFRLVFTGRGQLSEEKEIIMEEMDPTVFESLIHFAYTSRINISTENVQSLLVASELLQLDQVKDACVKFLSERLDVNNVAQVCTFALKHNNTKLLEKTCIYITQNFEVFYESDDYLHLPHSCVKEIISRDDLRISREEIVFEAVMRWVKFSPSERENFLPELLSELRLIQLPVRYLINEVATQDLIRVSIPCRDLIQNVQNYHLLPKQEASFLNLKTQPRTCGYITIGIYAVCKSISLGYSVYHCEFNSCKWNLLKSDKLHLRDHLVRVSMVNESIYLFLQSQIAKFHLKTLKWEILKTTHMFIAGGALLSFENMIYCFGSYNFNYGERVRCFDTQMSVWLQEDGMYAFRCDSSAASIGESIYLTGGEDLKSITNTVAKYSPAERQWTVIASMLRGRMCHGCTSWNGKIYVCGGSNGLEQLNSAEVFDPVIGKWNLICPVITAKPQCSLILQNSQIFAFCCQPIDDCDDFEIYDEEIGRWKKSTFPVPSGFINAVSMSRTAK